MDADGNPYGCTRGRGWRSMSRWQRNGPPGQILRRSMRGFPPKEHGGTAVETAAAISVVVLAFAALLEIVNIAFESDRMDRAARAAARATALDANADACAAIRRELRLAYDFNCAAWAITVHRTFSRRISPMRSGRGLPTRPATWFSSGSIGAAPSGRSRTSFPPPSRPMIPARTIRTDPRTRASSRVSQSVSPAARPSTEPPMLRARFPAMPPLVREQRGSAGIECALGAVALIGVCAVCFDLYARLGADTAASRMAVTMADYVSRDTAPEGAELAALGAFLHEHELEAPADLAYVITALRQPAGNPLPEVEVLWSDDSIRIGDAATTQELAGGCARHVTAADTADLPEHFAMDPGDVLVLAEVCARLTREGSLTGRFIMGTSTASMRCPPATRTIRRPRRPDRWPNRAALRSVRPPPSTEEITVMKTAEARGGRAGAAHPRISNAGDGFEAPVPYPIRRPARKAGAKSTPAAGTVGPLRSTPSRRSKGIMSNRVTKHKSRRFRRFFRANEAVSALEYAILVGVIAVGVGAAIVTFGDQVEAALKNIGDNVAKVKTDGAKTLKGGA